MRRFSGIPAQYETYVEGRIAEIVDEVRNDAWRRKNGHPSKIPDFAIDKRNRGKSDLGVIACCSEEELYPNPQRTT